MKTKVLEYGFTAIGKYLHYQAVDMESYPRIFESL